MNARENHKPRFFLTRQSANLLVDLDRQLAAAGSLVLLYGRSGTGKTALLEYFCRHRAATRQVWFVRFGEQGEAFRLDGDSGVHSTRRFQRVVLDRLGRGHLLVVDNLELAGEALFTTLLSFAAQHAESRDVRVVLVAHNSALAELQRRAQALGLAIPSVELKPLDTREAGHFVSELLCPEDQPSLVLNAGQRRRLKSAQGSFAALTHLARELNADANCAAVSSHRRSGRAFSGGVLVVLVLLVAVILVLVQGKWGDSLDHRVENTWPQAESSAELDQVVAESLPAPAVAEEPRVGVTPAPGETNQPDLISGGIDTPDPAENSTVDAAASVGPSAGSGMSASIDATAVAPDAEDQAGLELAQAANDRVEPLTAEPFPLLRSRLAAAMQWLQQAPESATSIQVMTLVFSDNTEQSLESFFQQLERQGIRLQAILVYQVLRSGRMAYVVLYGSYPDRQAALAAIPRLPRVLNKNGPIVRTLAGVRRDIEDSQR